MHDSQITHVSTNSFTNRQNIYVSFIYNSLIITSLSVPVLQVAGTVVKKTAATLLYVQRIKFIDKDSRDVEQLVIHMPSLSTVAQMIPLWMLVAVGKIWSWMQRYC